MKRMKMFLSSTLALMLLCTACSAPASNSSSAPASTPASSGDAAPASSGESAPTGVPKADLLVSVWGGPHADVQKSIVQDYSNGTVTIDDVDYGNLQSKQLTSFAAQAGSGSYDVVWVNSQWMEQYVNAGYLLPLDDYIQKAGVDTGIYASGLLEGCKVDGKLYGLPTYAQCLILCYDKTAFEEANLKVPTNIDELIEAAKYFKSKGTGIAIPAKQGSASTTLFSQLLYSDGNDYFGADGKLNLTSDAVVQAAGWYDTLVQNSIEGCAAWHHDEVAEAVRTKKAPMGIVMSALCNQNYDPDKSLIADTVAYAPLTGASGKAAAANTFWVWGVAANTANPETAADFCTWMTSNDIEKAQTLADQQVSAISALSEDAETLKVTPFLPVVMEALSNGKGDPQTGGFAELKAAMQASLSEIATTDAKPADVMTALQEAMKDVGFSK